jgi:hypothetical protein
VKDGHRAADVIQRIRQLATRTGPEKARPHDDDHVVVAVQDAGVGIDAQKTDQLFSAFYTTKPDGMGTGCRSVSRSSKRMADASGRHRTRIMARRSFSRCRRCHDAASDRHQDSLSSSLLKDTRTFYLRRL